MKDHAKMELESAGLLSKESDYNGMLGTAVLELMDTFSQQGHSGFSAGIVTDLFGKLSRFEPLSPLTGEDDEWIDHSDLTGYPHWQNRRCGRVFKEKDGAYDIDGRVFREPDGTTFTSYDSDGLDSSVPVTFPYTPKREIVDVPARQ